MTSEKLTLIRPDELALVNGGVYHLDLAAEELAQNLVVVGNPDRKKRFLWLIWR